MNYKFQSKNIFFKIILLSAVILFLSRCQIQFPDSNNDILAAIILQSEDIDEVIPEFAGATNGSPASSSAANLTWAPASDNFSEAASISYMICVSTISGDCQTNFTVNFTTNPGVTGFTVTGLSGITTYYFVVRAKDESGNIDTNSVEISTMTSPIYIISGPITNGNLQLNGGGANGRQGGDNLCTTEKSLNFSSLACQNIRAMISVPGDHIVNMTTNYSIPSTLPIRDATNTNTVANNWADMTNGNIGISLNAAGVVGGAYWTGANSTGGLGGNHCNGFISGGGGTNGRHGLHNVTGGTWLNNGNLSCNNARRIICICW